MVGVSLNPSVGGTAFWPCSLNHASTSLICSRQQMGQALCGHGGVLVVLVSKKWSGCLLRFFAVVVVVLVVVGSPHGRSGHGPVVHARHC